MQEPNHAHEAFLELLLVSSEQHWAVLDTKDRSYRMFDSQQEAHAKSKVGDRLIHVLPELVGPNSRGITSCLVI